METINAKQQSLKMQLWNSIPMDTPKKHFHTESSRNTVEKLSVKLCLLVMSDATPKKPHQDDCPKLELNKDNTHRYAKNGWGPRPQKQTKENIKNKTKQTIDNIKNIKKGKNSPPQARPHQLPIHPLNGQL